MAAFGYNNQSKIFRETSASKFQGQHDAYSDMMVYALHSGWLLRKFRTATFKNNCLELFLKRKHRKWKMRSDLCGFRFLLITFTYLLSHEIIFFHYKFSHSGTFQFGLRNLFL